MEVNEAMGVKKTGTSYKGLHKWLVKFRLHPSDTSFGMERNNHES